MRILIDTHILLWCLEDSPKLTAAARQLIEDPDNEIYVSKATAWEIEIKRMLGKLTIADDFMERIEEGFIWLLVELRHIKELRTLSSLSPIRASLIRKGMLYSPSHGKVAYTVPLFGDYMKRMVCS